jgi:hypothetical protein
VFAASGRVARRAVADRAAASPGARRVVDVVVTPAAANPLCASAIVVETAGDRYRVATARVATVPAVLSADRCGAAGSDAPGLRPSTRPPTAAVRWEREWDAPLAELVALAGENCEVAAMLRFVRVPFWRDAGADAVDFGDLRYAGRTARGFAEFRVPRRPTSCPRGVPPWQPPRAELLSGI